MKKVLMLANHASSIYLLRTELIEELLQRGYKVYISSPYGEQIEDFICRGCQYIETEIDRRGTHVIKDVMVFLKYIKMIKKIQPDVVLSYTVKPNLYGGIASRLNKVPYIPNITGLGSGFINGGIIQRIIRILSYFSFRGAYRVMVQNAEDLKILKGSKMVVDNYTLIPGSGVNLNEYQVLPYPDRDSPIVFNFIARIMRDKGIDEYLKAAKIIKKKYPEVIFKVIGMVEQDSYKHILEQYQKDNIIEYYGFQQKMQPFIKSCSCTINPSYTEGMSNVLLESAASGRPLIASNIPGCREIIDEGINGYLFENKNVVDLVKRIEDFLRLDYMKKVQMGLEGRKKIEQEFDRERVVSTYLGVIASL